MRINPTSTCVSLVLRALDQSVAPAAQTLEAQAALHVIKLTLNDLLKRQGPSIPILLATIRNGDALEQEIIEHLGRPYTTPAAVDLTYAGFDQLAVLYEDLTSRLDKEARLLSRQSGDDAAVEPLLRRLAQWEGEYTSKILPVPIAPFGDDPAVSPPAFETAASPYRLPATVLDDPTRQSSRSCRFRPRHGGYGKQTFKATVKQKPAPKQALGEDAESEDVSDIAERLEVLIVRKADPQPIMLHNTFRVDQEFDLLRSLAKTDYPAPQPLDLALDLPGIDGTFYTMNLVPGAIPRSFLDKGGKDSAISSTVLLQLAELLARLHAIPISTFEDYIVKYEDASALADNIGTRYARNMRGWRDYIDKVEHLPSPYVTWLFHWLEHNIPADARLPVLTHGDFAVHNVLAVDDRITGVLDWGELLFFSLRHLLFSSHRKY